MNIVDAHWESRNIGMKVQELRIEPSDSLAEIEVALLGLTGEYQVVRLVEMKFEFSELLSSHSFVFAETLFSFDYPDNGGLFGENGHKIPSLQRLTESEIDAAKNVVVNEILSGMFTTDRFSLNPNFSAEMTNQRYVYFVEDELSAGADLHLLGFRGSPVAFFTIREKPAGTAYVALSGVFPKHSLPGIGLALQKAIVLECRKQGLTHRNALVSCNNMPALRLHVSAGFQLTGVTHIYTRMPEQNN